MARTDPQVNFRIPAELKAQLEAAALSSGRTVTAEIVQRLAESFASEPSRTMGEKEIKVLARELRALMREEEDRRIAERKIG